MLHIYLITLTNLDLIEDTATILDILIQITNTELQIRP